MTVIKRRVSDSDFYKTWQEYKDGFGDLNENFWLGNENIHHLTNSGTYSLRIDLTAPNGESRFAMYSTFTVATETLGFRLSITDYKGTAGDSLAYHNGMMFSTKDRDNDLYSASCALTCHGCWWYKDCHESNLNGLFGETSYGIGVNWKRWLGYNVSMKKTEMKIKRV